MVRPTLNGREGSHHSGEALKPPSRGAESGHLVVIERRSRRITFLRTIVAVTHGCAAPSRGAGRTAMPHKAHKPPSIASVAQANYSTNIKLYISKPATAYWAAKKNG